MFPIDDLVMTVAKWYQFYSRPEYRDTYIAVPKQTQRKGKQNSKSFAFSVELYINVGQVRRVIHSCSFDLCLTNSQYAARTKDPEVVGSGRAGSKRKSSTALVTDGRVGSTSSKRARG